MEWEIGGRELLVGSAYAVAAAARIEFAIAAFEAGIGHVLGADIGTGVKMTARVTQKKSDDYFMSP